MGSRSLYGRRGMATWVTFACGLSGIFGEITYPAIQHEPHGEYLRWKTSPTSVYSDSPS